MKRRFLMASLAVGVMGMASFVSGALPENGFWGFVLCSFIIGSTGTFMNVPIMAYTQETIAPEMMGKVFSFMMTAFTWAMPVGLLIAGPVSELIGIDKWYFGSGLALIATGLLCRLITRRYDADTMLPEKTPSEIKQ